MSLKKIKLNKTKGISLIFIAIGLIILVIFQIVPNIFEEPLKYDVYFGITSPLPMVMRNISNMGNNVTLRYDPGTLSYNTLYYWRIVAWDKHSDSTNGSLWHFTTTVQKNQLPNIPSNPSPANSSMGVPIEAYLKWTCDNLDAGNTVKYDVYFGPSSDPPLKEHNQSNPSYKPTLENKTLAYETLYYWRIVSWDNHGAPKAGPLWQFTTIEKKQLLNDLKYPSPANGSTDVSINADLSWTRVEPYPHILLIQKMALTYLMIGILIFFFSTKEGLSLNSWDDRMVTIMIAWVIILFVLLSWFSWLDFDWYMIVMFLGILIIGELLGLLITTRFKKRFYILIILFLIAYIIIMADLMKFIPHIW